MTIATGDQRKLYRVTNAHLKTFYVACYNEAQAAEAVAKQWKQWNYIGDGTAIKIELIAEAKQYKTKNVDWFVVI